MKFPSSGTQSNVNTIFNEQFQQDDRELNNYVLFSILNASGNMVVNVQLARANSSF